MDVHSKMAEYADLRTRIDTAIAKGAAGIIFINTDKKTESPSKKYSNRITPATIPVVFASADAAAFIVESKSATISGECEILKNEKTGHNVLGYIDNNAPNTVVIGAHYDHLGWGIKVRIIAARKKRFITEPMIMRAERRL